MTDHNLSEQARGLRADVVALAGSVTDLAKRTQQSERTVTRIRRITVILGMVLVLGAASTIYLVVLGRRVAAQSTCQAEYNAVNNQRTRALTEVASAERAAERRAIDLLFDALFDPAVRKPAAERTAADRERIAALTAEVFQAVEALRVERAKADAARAANPVPDPPQTICTG